MTASAYPGKWQESVTEGTETGYGQSGRISGRSVLRTVLKEWT